MIQVPKASEEQMDIDFDEEEEIPTSAGMCTLNLRLSLNLSLSLSLSLTNFRMATSLYWSIGGVLFHVEWCIRLDSSCLLLSYPLTSLAYHITNHHTNNNIYFQTYKHIFILYLSIQQLHHQVVVKEKMVITVVEQWKLSLTLLMKEEKR